MSNPFNVKGGLDAEVTREKFKHKKRDPRKLLGQEESKARRSSQRKFIRENKGH